MNLPWKIGDEVAAPDFAELRRRAIFECDKWDPQVEDVSTLAPFPIVLRADAWKELAAIAEKLTQETLEAEAELLGRPELLPKLGLSWRIRHALRHATPSPPVQKSLRVMRFDFHYTTEGWKISEANTDVPGGYNEAAGFASLMAAYASHCHIAGDPAARLASSIRQITPQGGIVGLVHATAYSDDRQVLRFLARYLEREGLHTLLLAPDHINWRAGEAWACNDWYQGKLDFLFRFFPGEWLPNLPRSSGWSHFFHGSRTPLMNPGSALLTQSKRFPLVWSYLDGPLPTWRNLLPDTHDPRRVPWAKQSDWVLKPVWGRVGERIALPGVTDKTEWRHIARDVFWRPRAWIAQRPFEVVSLALGYGRIYPCFGVYTIAGKACGVYGRVASRPLINHCALDTAILVERELSLSCESESADRQLVLQK